MTPIFNKKSLKPRRRSLRRRSTETERILWSRLRRRQFHGLKFFRQYSVENYILDFYCPKKKVAIELDGFHHYQPEQWAYDERRTKWISQFGITVVRYPNNVIKENLEGVWVDLEGKLSVEV